MRCTSSNVLSLFYPVALRYPVAFDFLRLFPLASEVKDRDSIAERRCVNAATPIPEPTHNPIITLISALSAIRDAPDQSSYSTFAFRNNDNGIERSFASIPFFFSIEKKDSARLIPILWLEFYRLFLLDDRSWKKDEENAWKRSILNLL